MKFRFVWMALLLVGLTTACQPGSGRKRIAIVGAKLIDGTGAKPIPHSIVLIDGTTFQKVGPQSSIPLPKDAEIVDGNGKTVRPLILLDTVAPGKPANLVLESQDGQLRSMKDGQWQN